MQFLLTPAGTETAAGTVICDIANAHNYVQGSGSAGTTLIDNQAREAETIQPGPWDAYGEYWGPTWSKGFPGASAFQTDRPKETSETGWNIYANGANIGLPTQGKLETDLYLDGYQLGWSETILYKMFDEPSSTACADCGNSLFSNAGNGATEGDAGNAYPAGVYTPQLDVNPER